MDEDQSIDTVVEERDNIDNENSYTAEQVSTVNKILEHGQDYYKILDASTEVSEADLKKAYRRLALIVHPDKNKATGSGEAFKKVGKAYEILSDPEKKKKYDTYGPELKPKGVWRVLSTLQNSNKPKIKNIYFFKYLGM